MHTADTVEEWCVQQYTVEPLYSGYHWDPQLAVLYREVAISQEVDFIHSSLWLGIRRVSFIQRFHCMYMDQFEQCGNMSCKITVLSLQEAMSTQNHFQFEL